MENTKQFKVSIGGQDLVIETGLLAMQAAGAVTVSYGDTVCTLPVTVSGKPGTLLEGFESGTGCGTFGRTSKSLACFHRPPYKLGGLGTCFQSLSRRVFFRFCHQTRSFLGGILGGFCTMLSL